MTTCPRCGHKTCPTLRGEQSPAAEMYHLRLLRTMRECDHPPGFRRAPSWLAAVPFDVKPLDPNEWECEVCGTAQVREIPTPRESRFTP